MTRTRTRQTPWGALTIASVRSTLWPGPDQIGARSLIEAFVMVVSLAARPVRASLPRAVSQLPVGAAHLDLTSVSNV